MGIIDSHIHFWDLSNNINNWVHRVNTPSLEKNYLPNTMIKNFKENLYGVAHIEAHDSAIPTVQEVKWLNEVMKNTSDLKYSHVAFVDITLPKNEFSSILDTLKTYDHVKGIRHILSCNQKFNYSPCDTDLSTNPNIQDNLNYLAKVKFIFNCQMYPYQLNNILPAIASSGVTCVVDHLVLPAWNQTGDADHQVWQDIIIKLAKLNNAFIKVSGIDMFRKETEFKEVLDFCLNKFPTSRLMYGSNYPVSFNHDYNYWYEYLNKMDLSENTKKQIFFKNAHDVFFRD